MKRQRNALFVVHETSSAGPIDSDDTLDDALAWLAAVEQATTTLSLAVVEKGHREIGGVLVGRAVVECFREGAMDHRRLLYLVPRGERMGVLTYSAPAAEWEKKLPLFETSAATRGAVPRAAAWEDAARRPADREGAPARLARVERAARGPLFTLALTFGTLLCAAGWLLGR